MTTPAARRHKVRRDSKPEARSTKPQILGLGTRLF
jgi:hypothetical protein